MSLTVDGAGRTPVAVDSFRFVSELAKASEREARGERKQRFEGSLVLIDQRALDRECLAKALGDRGLCMEVSAVGSVEEWRREQVQFPPVQAVLFNIGNRKAEDAGFANEITKLRNEFKSSPVIVLSDNEDLTQIVKMLEYGVRGFIPSCVGVSVCVGAIELAVAGGVFVPASSVLAMRHLLATSSSAEARNLSGMFTARQEAVVEALRRGKANKIIAYELKLRESTVKVHIRNIMKKLKATNRTEVAYKLNDMFPMN
jgi:DNA-binding NarL/FixJ family response regulator